MRHIVILRIGGIARGYENLSRMNRKCLPPENANQNLWEDYGRGLERPEPKRKGGEKMLEWSRGNTKVPYRVVNMCAARDCPSRKLGLCQCPSQCYADKAERQYPEVLPFRRRQGKFWKQATPGTVLVAANRMEQERTRARSKRMRKRVLRFSEAGDFKDQGQVNLFAIFAHRLISLGWTVYGYTARIDLDLSPMLSVGVKVNLSGDSRKLKKKTNRFLVVPVASGNNFTCPGDCSLCSVCRSVTGKTIEVVAH